MEIVGAMDLHRRQITFKWQDLGTGEIKRGRIMPAARGPVREWISQFRGRDAHFALEATTGWRFVVEEMQRIGVTPHLAEPAETSIRRGPKRRAKTDHKDCDHMVDLLLHDRLPKSWIPPHHILELRAQVRLRKALLDERREWQQRIQAQLYHQGVPPGIRLSTAQGRARLAQADLSPVGRQVITVGVGMLDGLDAQMLPLDAQLISIAKAQPGCRALMSLFGVGGLTSATVLAELGDCRRFSSSDDAVRYAGLDITVYESNGKRPPGHLSRQGPEVLRWALYEAAQSAARRTSPDYAYYLKTRDRIDHNRACLAVARKLCRRAHHILRELGDRALQPVGANTPTQPPRPPDALRSPPEMAAARDVSHIMPMFFAAGSRNSPVATARPWTSLKDRAAATFHPGSTPSLIMSPEHAPSTEIRLGDRARDNVSLTARREVVSIA